jgi:hypothetical protein
MLYQGYNCLDLARTISEHQDNAEQRGSAEVSSACQARGAISVAEVLIVHPVLELGLMDFALFAAGQSAP